MGLAHRRVSVAQWWSIRARGLKIDSLWELRIFSFFHTHRKTKNIFLWHIFCSTGLLFSWLEHAEQEFSPLLVCLNVLNPDLSLFAISLGSSTSISSSWGGGKKRKEIWINNCNHLFIIRQTFFFTSVLLKSAKINTVIMISFIFHFSPKRKFSLAGHFPRWLKLSHSWKCVALFKFGCLGEFLITCSHFYYLPPISVPKVSHVRQQFCGPDSVRKN